MPVFAAVINSAVPPLNMVAVTVAELQPDSNCPATPEDSSTPLCLREVMLPLVPLIVNASPEPVSKVKLVAAEAGGAQYNTPAPTATTAAATVASLPISRL